MRRILLTAITSVALISGGARAQNTLEAGAGTLTCSDVSKKYAENSQFWGFIFMAWAQGYMSGLNIEPKAEVENKVTFLARHTNMDLLSASADDQETAIRKYCLAHPSALYMEAVDSVYLALRANLSTGKSAPN